MSKVAIFWEVPAAVIVAEDGVSKLDVAFRAEAACEVSNSIFVFKFTNPFISADDFSW